MELKNFKENFESIALKEADVAKIVSMLINEGSKRNMVTKEDLTIVSDNTNCPKAFANVMEAINHGTKLFDALYYFSLDEKSRPSVKTAAEDDIPVSRKLSDISRALFYQVFLCLVRGSPNDSDASASNEKIPNFLVSIMGLKNKPSYYSNMLASFSLSKVDWRFIKSIDFGQLDTAAINRIGLSVAGYRIMQPFKYYTCKSDASEEERNAYEVVRKLAGEGADWNVHPITKSAEFTGYYGSFTKNVGSLIIACFSDSQIQGMVDSKMLYSKPIANMQYTGWKAWKVSTMPVFNDKIFSNDKAIRSTKR